MINIDDESRYYFEAKTEEELELLKHLREPLDFRSMDNPLLLEIKRSYGYLRDSSDIDESYHIIHRFDYKELTLQDVKKLLLELSLGISNIT